eukprot:scaffold3089_cov136-Isochrysis_galbana.AAC.4
MTRDDARSRQAGVWGVALWRLQRPPAPVTPAPARGRRRDGAALYAAPRGCGGRREPRDGGHKHQSGTGHSHSAT